MSTTTNLTAAFLKGLLTDALVYRGYCADLDAENGAGVYYVGSAAKNKPWFAWAYGTLIEVWTADGPSAQIFFVFGSSICGFRTTTAKGWGEWKQFATISQT